MHLINSDDEAKHAINLRLRFRYNLFVVISQVQSSLIRSNEQYLSVFRMQDVTSSTRKLSPIKLRIGDAFSVR